MATKLNVDYLTSLVNASVVFEEWFQARQKVTEIHPALKYILTTYHESLQPLLYYIYTNPEIYIALDLKEARIPSYTDLDNNLTSFIAQNTKKDWVKQYQHYKRNIKQDSIDVFVQRCAIDDFIDRFHDPYENTLNSVIGTSEEMLFAVFPFVEQFDRVLFPELLLSM